MRVDDERAPSGAGAMMRIPRWRYRMLLRNKDGSQVEAVCPDVHKLIELQRQFERCGGGELLELRREDHPIVRPVGR